MTNETIRVIIGKTKGSGISKPTKTLTLANVSVETMYDIIDSAIEERNLDIEVEAIGDLKFGKHKKSMTDKEMTKQAKVLSAKNKIKRV